MRRAKRILTDAGEVALVALVALSAMAAVLLIDGFTGRPDGTGTGYTCNEPMRR